MWELPRPGIEPVSPALAGGFLTTAPPGKSLGVACWYKPLLHSEEELPLCATADIRQTKKLRQEGIHAVCFHLYEAIEEGKLNSAGRGELEVTWGGWVWLGGGTRDPPGSWNFAVCRGSGFMRVYVYSHAIQVGCSLYLPCSTSPLHSHDYPILWIIQLNQ